ncbi:MAG: hypothetical protein JNK63_04390 [Chthonomonas sp.]|nr:hypothetical protein [Chthonomonas sp.]
MNISDEEFQEKLAAHRERREQLIAKLYSVFAAVTREGGVSWSEAEYLDGPPRKMADRLKVRAKDKEKSWHDLIDDPNFNPIRGFSFLDSIGFRYYMVPTMIRELKGREERALDFYLDKRHKQPQGDIINRPGYRLQLSTSFPFIFLVWDDESVIGNYWACFTADQLACVDEFEAVMKESDHWGFNPYVGGQIP